MTSGPRHLSPMSEDARRVLDAYRSATPGPDRRDANREALRRRLEADVPTPAAAAGLAWPLGWALVSAVAAAGLIWGIVATGDPVSSGYEPSAPSEAASTQSAQAPSKLAAQPPRGPVASPTAAPPSPAAHARVPESPPREPDSAVPDTSSSIVEETRTLRAARARMARGDLEGAAGLLNRYTTRFPDGALREDAQAYRVLVRCAQGEDVAALRRAFERRYPVSPHLARIEAACGEEKK